MPEGTLSVAATVQENLKKSARRADANTELESPVWPYGQQQSYSAQMGSMPHSAGHAPDEYHAQMAAAAAMAAAGMAPMMPPGGQHFYMPQPFFPPPNFGFPV